jgi:hypothetical protein
LFQQNVIEINDSTITANTAYTNCLKMITESFVSAKDVTQLADRESGTIIVKYLQIVKPHQTFMYSAWNYETKLILKIEIKNSPKGGIKVRFTHNSEQLRIWSFYDGRLNQFTGNYNTFYPLGEEAIYNTKNWKVAQALGLANSITEFKMASRKFQEKIIQSLNEKPDEW